MAFTYKVQKGDTLNSIANRYGFKNYKEAGISAVPSGNFDLIREGEDITLANYNPKDVTPIGSTPPVVSSKDNAQQYREDSNILDNVIGNQTKANDANTTKEGDTTKKDPAVFAPNLDTNGKQVGDERGYTETGNAVTDAYGKFISSLQAKADQYNAEADASKENYKSLYTTSLSAIDATAQATIDRINTTYDKRVEEQKRINAINIGRVKAYGLGNGGQYVPLQYSDAVSNREQEASDKISSLESQRTSLIAEAKSARDAGASKLLRDKLADLDRIDSELRKTLADVEKEANDQYKLLRDLRKEEETKHQEQIKKMLANLTAIAPQYADEYEQMSTEEKDAFVQKLVEQTGLEYASVYATLESAVAGVTEKEQKSRKAEADIKASEALSYQRNTAGAKNLADIALKDKERQDKLKMNEEIPDTFASEEDFLAQRQAYVKKYGVEGGKLWDNVFNKDDVGDYTYTIDANAGSGDRVTVVAPDGTEGTIPKEQLQEALKAGYKQK